MNTPQNTYPCGNCLHIDATPDVAPCADCREDLTAQPVRFTGFVDWRTEVERLRAELAAMRAQEPVAWQYRYQLETGGMSAWVGCDAAHATRNAQSPDHEFRPLYTAPQPAAAPAGELIGYLEFGTDQPRTPVYAKQEPAEKRTDWSAS